MHHIYKCLYNYFLSEDLSIEFPFNQLILVIKYIWVKTILENQKILLAKGLLWMIILDSINKGNEIMNIWKYENMITEEVQTL